MGRHRGQRAIPARKAPLALRGHKASRESRGYKVKQEHKGLKVPKELPEKRARRETEGRRATKEIKAIPRKAMPGYQLVLFKPTVKSAVRQMKLWLLFFVPAAVLLME